MMNKLIDIVLFTMFAMLLFLTALLVAGAYANHKIAYVVCADTLKSIEGAVRLAYATGTNAPSLQIFTSGVTELEKAKAELFDANTVSFLFQVLLLCLVTVGVYLLKSTVAEVKKAEVARKQAESAGSKAETAATAVEQAGRAATAAAAKASNVADEVYTRSDKMQKAISEQVESRLRQLSQVMDGLTEASCDSVFLAFQYRRVEEGLERLKEASQVELAASVCLVREELKSIEGKLSDMKTYGQPIEPSVFDTVIFDCATRTHHMLKQLPGTPAERRASGVDDLTDRSSKCLELLLNGSFKERYSQLVSIVKEPIKRQVSA